MDDKFEDYLNRLKVDGKKRTIQKEIIFKLLCSNSNKHYTAEEIRDILIVQYPNVNLGIATVYRVLKELEDTGYIGSVSIDNAIRKFEFNTTSHHDHMICKECGTIIEFYDEVIERIQKKIADKHGFKMMNHSMQLYGTCQKCQNK